jgi:hypothetical protein
VDSYCGAAAVRAHRRRDRQAALRLTGRRRGQHSRIAAGGVVAGGLAYLFVGSGGSILGVPILLYVAITAGAVYSMYRIRI